MDFWTRHAALIVVCILLPLGVTFYADTRATVAAAEKASNVSAKAAPGALDAQLKLEAHRLVSVALTVGQKITDEKFMTDMARPARRPSAVRSMVKLLDGVVPRSGFAWAIDKKGAIVARNGRPEVDEKPEHITGHPLFAKTQFGYAIDGFWQKDGTTYFIGAVPLIRNGTASGAILVGHPLDEPFVKRLASRMRGTEITFVVNRKIVATSFADRGAAAAVVSSVRDSAEPVLGGRLPKPLESGVLPFTPLFVERHADGIAYASVSSLAPGSSGVKWVTSVVVGDTLSDLASRQEIMLALLLAALLLSIVIGLVMQRTFVRPIDTIIDHLSDLHRRRGIDRELEEFKVSKPYKRLVKLLNITLKKLPQGLDGMDGSAMSIPPMSGATSSPGASLPANPSGGMPIPSGGSPSAPGMAVPATLDGAMGSLPPADGSQPLDLSLGGRGGGSMPPPASMPPQGSLPPLGSLAPGGMDSLSNSAGFGGPGSLSDPGLPAAPLTSPGVTEANSLSNPGLAAASPLSNPGLAAASPLSNPGLPAASPLSDPGLPALSDPGLPALSDPGLPALSDPGLPAASAGLPSPGLPTTTPPPGPQGGSSDEDAAAMEAIAALTGGSAPTPSLPPVPSMGASLPPPPGPSAASDIRGGMPSLSEDDYGDDEGMGDATVAGFMMPDELKQAASDATPLPPSSQEAPASADEPEAPPMGESTMVAQVMDDLLAATREAADDVSPAPAVPEVSEPKANAFDAAPSSSAFDAAPSSSAFDAAPAAAALASPAGSGAFEAAASAAPMAGESADRTMMAAIPSDLLAKARGEVEVVAPPEPSGGNGLEAADQTHFRETYDKFIEMRKTCGEAISDLSFDKFSAKLKKNRAGLIKKYGCKTVRFQVYEKEGRAALKATPIRGEARA